MSDAKTISPTEEEAATARWKAVLNDPAFMDALLAGVPKRPPDWWKQRPDEDAIGFMFRMFPVVRPN